MPAFPPRLPTSPDGPRASLQQHVSLAMLNPLPVPAKMMSAQQYGPAPAMLAVDEFPLCEQYGLGSSLPAFGCYNSLAHHTSSASAVSWSTTEPTVNVPPMAEQQQQQQQQLWSAAGPGAAADPGLLCMQQEQGGCFSSSLADDEAAQFGGGDACYADYPHGALTMCPLESVPLSLPDAAMDLGQWQVYLSHFVPAMQVVNSFADLTSEQRQQAIKFASDIALSQAAAGVDDQPCLQEEAQEEGLWHHHHHHQLMLQKSGMLATVDGYGSWNYAFSDEGNQLVTAAALPTYLRNEGEQADVGVSVPSSDEFRCGFSTSKHYSQYESGQGCHVSAPPFLAQEIDQQYHHHHFFGSSSECVREANSSGSDNLIGESASNLSSSWRAATEMHSIAAAPEFSIRVELPDESSSVANDADILDSTVRSQFNRVPQLDPIDTLSCGSWIAQCKASDSESSGSMQEAGKNFDSAIWNAPAPSLMNGNNLPAGTANPELEDVAAFKRQRVACYTLESLSKAVNLHLEKEALAAGTIKATSRVAALGRPVLFGDAERTRDFTLANRTVFADDATRPVFQSAILEQRESGDAKPCYRKIPATSVEPQSVAARQRRKKISERVRVLEQLIPGGHKMDTASMLDEAIEYVKFLQLQVNILESLGSITDQAHSPAISSSSNNGYGFDLVRDAHLEAVPELGLKSSSLLSARPSGACPLIMSEVLQQQLFKHKLCIVSLRQCTLPSCSS